MYYNQQKDGDFLTDFLVFLFTMTFSNTTTKDGIIQDCEFWLFGANYGTITNNSNLLNTFTALSNRALDSVSIIAMGADDRWQFDDTNHTDYPIATTNLVTDQRDYVLSVSHLRITRVEIKDDQGNWTILTPFDLADIGIARDEFMNTSATPMYYDKLGNSLFLYPAPNYSQSASLRVYFQREPSYFLSTDTTKSPGFASIFHRLVPLNACLDYATANNLTDKITVLNTKIKEQEEEIKKFFGRRNRDERLTMRAVTTSTE